MQNEKGSEAGSQCENTERKSKQKEREEKQAKYIYLLYGISFGIVTGLLVGYYSHHLWPFTAIGGAAGLIIGGIVTLVHRRK